MQSCCARESHIPNFDELRDHSAWRSHRSYYHTTKKRSEGNSKACSFISCDCCVLSSIFIKRMHKNTRKRLQNKTYDEIDKSVHENCSGVFFQNIVVVHHACFSIAYYYKTEKCVCSLVGEKNKHFHYFSFFRTCVWKGRTKEVKNKWWNVFVFNIFFGTGCH